jgi:hypothetical protein
MLELVAAGLGPGAIFNMESGAIFNSGGLAVSDEGEEEEKEITFKEVLIDHGRQYWESFDQRRAEAFERR